MDVHLIATCRICGDRIGVYEPMVVVDPAGSRLTSRVREPELDEATAPLFHARCAENAGLNAGLHPLS